MAKAESRETQAMEERRQVHQAPPRGNSTYEDDLMEDQAGGRSTAVRTPRLAVTTGKLYVLLGRNKQDVRTGVLCA